MNKPNEWSVYALIGVLLAIALPNYQAAPASATQTSPLRIPISPVRLPAELSAKRLETDPLSRLDSARNRKRGILDANPEAMPADNNAVPIQYTYQGLVGTVNVGSPAQSVSVEFSLRSPNFFLFDTSVHDCNSGTTGFNVNASTTAVVNNKYFYAVGDGTVTGAITVTDSIEFNNLSITNLTFGVSNKANLNGLLIADQVDGIIGLSPYNNSYATNITGFVPQLNASVYKALASVAFTAPSVNASQYDQYDLMNTTGQITIGAEDADACTKGSYTYVPINPYVLTAGFRVDSITGQTPSGDALNFTVNADRTTVISELYSVISGTRQFRQLLRNASGLVLKSNYQSVNYYNVSCDKAANVKDLTLHLAGGGTLTLSPWDYIFKSVDSDGTEECASIMYDYDFEETDEFSSTLPIELGQSFLNNHCYTINYADGTIGIARTEAQTQMTYYSDQYQPYR